MVPNPVHVSIENDYELVVSGLAGLLSPYWHRVTLVEVVAGEVAADPVDVLLYDTFGHTRDLRTVLAESGARRLIVYTWPGSNPRIAAVLATGASGYVTKGIGAEGLVDAVERVHAGEVVVDGAVRARTSSPGEDWPGRAEGLSPREAEIVAWIACGYSNREVADRAYLGINTVKTYIRSAYGKMEVTSRTKAVLWALDHGFTPPDPTVPRDDPDEIG